MINPTIGYIICESEYTQGPVNVQPKEINGKVIGEGIIQTANEKNRNGRFYSREELFPQLTAPRTLELLNAGYLRAELGHPLSKDLQRQSTIDDTKTCARFLKLWTQGDNVWAQFCGTNNDYGKTFDMDLREGCMPAWSLRALGSVKQTNRGCEVENLRVITWDQVIYPSHPGAYTQRLVTEAVTLNESALVSEKVEFDTENKGLFIPIANESVISFLQSQSQNLKFVKECMDFMYKGIQVNEAGTKVILTSDTDTIVVNLESYIHNELMEYATEYAKLREI